MIQLTNVSFGYRRQKPVLQEINLEIKPGNIYGLLGKNGEGKTTLLNIMSGLLFPDKGECLVFNEMPEKRKAHFLQNIFLLPEEINLPDVTGQEYIKMFAPFYPTFSNEIFEACKESFDIDLTAPLRKMSLGQKKKAAIMLALSANTPLLLMDEPTNGLDIPSKSIFRKLLASHISEEQTVIISTHQVRDLESLIDSVIILDRKEILFNKPLDEISRKLDFRKVETEEASFYSEPSPSGTVGVVVNDTAEKSIVSLELLFNAATSSASRSKIKDIINH
ncbi:ABC-2 type transport system ATP-binding protein [Parabacteroides sp. PF5-5]|uniref:ABC transporter ATP-binding protein n=1 Tax=unclassified Parabacteroides TaxID=2649774 RepID=UPI002473178A|nr:MULTISPECIES: ABC transporter ATP-binding protein [unclassified Parabacteroides]MDH6304296.1 ABC-2 type transport system ATP-binding protein [Parabacteroides sp. PH5-39]MDH6315551.1 ABC-2 type transport system ATP-binding protein [Parabacteroides sp. PF5-13]MDH6318955.1 ABC-2 type transport system ATP-binding protein [Parabacteroides sp. PH5-13]MDH6322684.1 ABC-2 type transport system ATP-binding protein [Parabacteroides sp. PH5-8]MDH6326744.1 ABC-2 type transport system ATP-binding protein